MKPEELINQVRRLEAQAKALYQERDELLECFINAHGIHTEFLMEIDGKLKLVTVCDQFKSTQKDFLAKVTGVKRFEWSAKAAPKGE